MLKHFLDDNSYCIQRRRQSVKRLGGMHRRLSYIGRRGATDSLVIWPQGVIHFVELKTDTGTTSALQDLEHNQLRQFGCEVFVLRGEKEVADYFDQCRGMVC